MCGKKQKSILCISVKYLFCMQFSKFEMYLRIISKKHISIFSFQLNNHLLTSLMKCAFDILATDSCSDGIK